MRKLGYKKGDYATISVEISDEMLSKLETLIERSWGQIKSLRFEKPPKRDDEKCGRCDFDSICWGGRIE